MVDLKKVKIGDRLRVKPGAPKDETPIVSWVSEMNASAGREGKVTIVREDLGYLMLRCGGDESESWCYDPSWLDYPEAPASSAKSRGPHKCNCEWRTVWVSGCKCGGC